MQEFKEAAAELLLLEGNVVVCDHGGVVGDDGAKVHEDDEGGEDPEGSDSGEGGGGVGEERHDGGDGGNRHSTPRMLPDVRHAQPELPGAVVLRRLVPRVEEYEDIVRADPQDDEDGEHVEHAEVALAEHEVEHVGDGEAPEDLQQAHIGEEPRARHEHHVEKHEYHGPHRQGAVSRELFLSVLRDAAGAVVPHIELVVGQRGEVVVEVIKHPLGEFRLLPLCVVVHVPIPRDGGRKLEHRAQRPAVGGLRPEGRIHAGIERGRSAPRGRVREVYVTVGPQPARHEGVVVGPRVGAAGGRGALEQPRGHGANVVAVGAPVGRGLARLGHAEVWGTRRGSIVLGRDLLGSHRCLSVEVVRRPVEAAHGVEACRGEHLSLDLRDLLKVLAREHGALLGHVEDLQLKVFARELFGLANGVLLPQLDPGHGKRDVRVIEALLHCIDPSLGDVVPEIQRHLGAEGKEVAPQ
mmetsp:Transcript_17235/g.55207  ORF Transcript_17235/g.55207 Transcript_17235/m.55207 type:complete len:466 (-) Transcript_17235:951-2348(-)